MYTTAHIPWKTTDTFQAMEMQMTVQVHSASSLNQQHYASYKMYCLIVEIYSLVESVLWIRSKLILSSRSDNLF